MNNLLIETSLIADIGSLPILADLGSSLQTVKSVLSVAIGLGLVIFFHELGHFLVAKWCGVHVERFSIGFGPILWSRQKGETEYALSALPLGGYVKMLGQDDLDPNQMASEEIAENPRAYSSKSVSRRMAIISAGVIMNILTGILFFAFAYHMGVDEGIPVVQAVVTGSPAWSAGLRPGDRIETINGKQMIADSDVRETIILSHGTVRVAGVHESGEKFDVEITPTAESGMRMIGVDPGTSTLQLDPLILPDAPITIPRVPEEAPSADFLPGDTVTQVQGIAAKSFAHMRKLTAAYSEEPLVYTIDRPQSSGQSETVEIVVPALPVRSVGLWMRPGPVRAIRQGSIAEAAGLKIGDQLLTVDGMHIGVDCDPLHLPVYIASRAGQEVVLEVDREMPATGNQTETIRLIPAADEPGWAADQLSITAPLDVPSAGFAFQVSSVIAKVVPGSEADATGKFKEGMRIRQVELIMDEAKKNAGTRDFLSSRKSPGKTVTISLQELPARSLGRVEDINWAFVFEQIQSAPHRNIRLFIDDLQGESAKDGSVLLETFESAEGWHAWKRGISGWKVATTNQKSESLADSLSMGVRKTKKTLIVLYLTLRSLAMGDLPLDAFSGPLGIATIAKRQADEGLPHLLVFLGLLSMNLAVLNFLPIPVLDGGHMVFLLWEGISRRKPGVRMVRWAHAAGFLLIISLFAYVMYLDLFVHKLATGG
ncbi:MAG: RIP metalloprotease RseP [Planctomycetaceae bacterium]|nr:RIP metalloprotease RseP [Planctomycetaceae bacterium]